MPSVGEPSRAELGAYFLSMLPTALRAEAVSDEGFLAILDLSAHLPALSVGSRFTFPQAALFSAVRAACGGTGSAVLVEDARGQTVDCLVRGDAVFFSWETADGAREEREAPSYLAALSEDAGVRVQALHRVIALCGPTGPDLAVWQPLLEAGPPSDATMAAFVAEIIDSLPFRAAGMRASLSAGSLDRDRLVPASLRYWEGVCGPAPGTTPIGDWLGQAWGTHVRRLARVSPPQAFRICAATNVRAGMLVPEALPPASDLLQLVEPALASWGPFALLSFVEAAAQRSGEAPELREAARRGAARLLSATLPRPDGVDRLATFAKCYRLASRTLAVARWMTGQPAWWRRLCAFAQADVLLDALGELEFDPAELREGFDVITPATGWIAEALAARESPLWRAECGEAAWLRAEVLGRLALLQASDGGLLDHEALQAALQEAGKACRDPIAPFAPGPLEMEAVPAQDIATLPELSDAVRTALAQLSEAGRVTGMWRFLDFASRHRRFDQETLDCLRAASVGLRPVPGEGDDGWAPLMHAARIAASQRSTGMAEAVLGSVSGAAGSLTRADAAVQVAMAAAAAWPDPAEGLDRLSACLRHLAAVAPPAACADLEVMLNLLAGATSPSDWWRLSPARALASLGARARRAPGYGPDS